MVAYQHLKCVITTPIQSEPISYIRVPSRLAYILTFAKIVAF